MRNRTNAVRLVQTRAKIVVQCDHANDTTGTEIFLADMEAMTPTGFKPWM